MLVPYRVVASGEIPTLEETSFLDGATRVMMPGPEAVGILSGRLGMSPLEMSSFSRKPMEFGAADFETRLLPHLLPQHATF